MNDNAQHYETTLQETMIQALHRDQRVNAFLYGDKEPSPALIDDKDFIERVLCLRIAVEQEANGQDLFEIFSLMAQCAVINHMTTHVARDALDAIRQHIGLYKYNPPKPVLS